MIRKKTYLLPQELVDKVKRLFNARTETEALIGAMAEVLQRKDLSEWHGRNSGKFYLKDLYAR